MPVMEGKTLTHTPARPTMVTADSQSDRSSELPLGAIETVDPLADPAWDQQILREPGYSFFHGAAWARVLKDSYRHTPRYFVARNSGAIAALIPVVEIRSPLTGCRGVSLPFADCAPPLNLNRVGYRQLLQQVIAEGSKRGWKYLECRGGYELLDEVPSFMAFHAHILDLSIGQDQLFRKFEGRVRNAVRKAESMGVKIEISDSLQAVKDFYRLHGQTRRRHGVPPQPFQFFQNVYREILAKGNGIVALAKFQGAAVAAAVYFHLGRKAVYKYSASDKAAQQLRPNNLLMWEAIRWYAQAGCAEMHFGRTSLSNEGLRLYKRGFGTREEELHYIRYDFRKSSFLSGSEPAPGWPNRVCSLLPVPVLRLAGGLLYRHIS